jgi:hypothetical protein
MADVFQSGSSSWRIAFDGKRVNSLRGECQGKV